MSAPKPFYRSDGQIGNLGNTKIPIGEGKTRPGTPNDFEDMFGEKRYVPKFPVGHDPKLVEATPEELHRPCVFETETPVEPVVEDPAGNSLHMDNMRLFELLRKIPGAVNYDPEAVNIVHKPSKGLAQDDSVEELHQEIDQLLEKLRQFRSFSKYEQKLGPVPSHTEKKEV